MAVLPGEVCEAVADLVISEESVAQAEEKI
jgi:hypothetical protein